MLELLLSGFNAADLGTALMRVGAGLFFSISGYHKLFNADRHKSLVKTLEGDGVPLISVNQWFVPAIEFSAGMALIVGLLTPLAAAGLLAICCVATAVDGIKRISDWAPLDKADYLDDVLYLPEVVWLIVLVALILGGAGAYSLDAMLLEMLS